MFTSHSPSPKEPVQLLCTLQSEQSLYVQKHAQHIAQESLGLPDSATQHTEIDELKNMARQMLCKKSRGQQLLTASGDHMNKKALVPMIIVLILAVASVAIARNGYQQSGYHGGNWEAYNQLTPEKQQQVQTILKKYEDVFQSLKSQQWAKRTELNALVESGKADKDTIHALVQELSQIRDKVFTEHKKMADEIEKETGITFPSMGQGFGKGNRGCGNYRQGECPGGGSNCPGLGS